MSTPKHAMGFMLAWLAVQLASSFFGYGAALNGIPFVTVQIAVQVIGCLLPVLSAYVFYRVKGGAGPFVPSAPPQGKLLAYSVLIGFLIQPAGMFVSALSSIFDNAPIEAIQGIAGAAEPWEVMLTLGVLPAVTEELVARGVALNGFRRVRPWKAAAINGVIFGVMHMNLRQFFYAFALGTVIAIVVIRGGSVLYGIIVHFVINVTQVWMMRLPELDERGAALLSAGYLFALPIGIAGFIAALKRFPANRLKPEKAGGAEEADEKALNWVFWVFIAIGAVLTAVNF